MWFQVKTIYSNRIGRSTNPKERYGNEPLIQLKTDLHKLQVGKTKKKIMSKHNLCGTLERGTFETTLYVVPPLLVLVWFFAKPYRCIAMCILYSFPNLI